MLLIIAVKAVPTNTLAMATIANRKDILGTDKWLNSPIYRIATVMAPTRTMVMVRIQNTIRVNNTVRVRRTRLLFLLIISSPPCTPVP